MFLRNLTGHTLLAKLVDGGTGVQAANGRLLHYRLTSALIARATLAE